MYNELGKISKEFCDSSFCISYGHFTIFLDHSYVLIFDLFFELVIPIVSPLFVSYATNRHYFAINNDIYEFAVDVLSNYQDSNKDNYIQILTHPTLVNGSFFLLLYYGPNACLHKLPFNKNINLVLSVRDLFSY